MSKPDIKTTALQRLCKRREALQKAYDETLAQPAGYSISGSVSVTSQKLDALRAEIDSVEAQITALVGAAGPGGLRRTYPVYVDSVKEE